LLIIYAVEKKCVWFHEEIFFLQRFYR